MKPDKLRYYLQFLSQSLGHKAQWGEKSSTHIYGIIGVIGTFATVIGLLLAFSELKQSKKPSIESIGLLQKEKILHEVKDIRSSTPVILNEPSSTRIHVDQVPKTTKIKNSFKLIEHKVTLDMRSFQETELVDRSLMTSPVVQSIEQKIKKLDDSPSYLLLAHTSGIDVFSKSHNDDHQLTVYASEERPNVGEYTVKPRVLEFDVSSVPREEYFTVDVSKTFWNAFQDDIEQSWVGIQVKFPTRRIEYLIVFPDDKPYTEFEHFKHKNDGVRIDLHEKQHVLEDPNKRWIYWEIIDPVPGHGYNIDWEWE